MKKSLILLAIVSLIALCSSGVFAKSSHQLNITEVKVDLQNSNITIVGVNFGRRFPTVTLADTELYVLTYSGTEITAELTDEFGPGSYTLKVSTGKGRPNNDDFEVTIQGSDSGTPPTAAVRKVYNIEIDPNEDGDIIDDGYYSDFHWKRIDIPEIDLNDPPLLQIWASNKVMTQYLQPAFAEENLGDGDWIPPVTEMGPFLYGGHLYFIYKTVYGDGETLYWDILPDDDGILRFKIVVVK